jgi:hypothetical protein
MTELLKKAFEKASEKLPDYEQDEIAQWLLNAIEADEHRWDVALSDPSENEEARRSGSRGHPRRPH